MKKLILIFSIALFSNIQAQTWKTEDQYIQRFAQYAVEEMELYNIPASITLAQGLLETGGGQSRLAQEGKNHFGIKCKENWTGKTMKHTDDAPNECFRVYEDPRESYRDHSLFLVNRPFYKNLFQLDPKDYNGWAHGLK
ncbi:glycoside hydrolase family 73 protein, partial [Cloacibacterium sp.]|uniref:glycoside hydrolase family 73 protein n=1 Tax=Cloacibacterium sp. TaxID=1913682 RepID=UPI0035AE7F96